ncbi:MAG TPA: hypothetical protein PKZ97_05395 [Azospirillaceae bacterium]|nr:hypothetical protein [Azospirillaceae bacterium]HRQ80533.1 hypothetical protein [Azospirillaceae bacterium]
MAFSDMHEKFNIGNFIVGVLLSALLLLAMPIGIIFHPLALLYATLFGTAAMFVVIFVLTGKTKA